MFSVSYYCLSSFHSFLSYLKNNTNRIKIIFYCFAIVKNRNIHRIASLNYLTDYIVHRSLRITYCICLPSPYIVHKACYILSWFYLSNSFLLYTSYSYFLITSFNCSTINRVTNTLQALFSIGSRRLWR